MRFQSLLFLAGLAAALPSSLTKRVETNTTIVISPGAWLLKEQWDIFRTKLALAGYSSELVPHLSVGQDSTAGLAADTANLQATLEKLSDAGKEIVLFGHSYGGAVISSATEGLDVATRAAAGKTGGVLLNAYLAAFVLPIGKSLIDLLGGEPLYWMDVQGDIVVANASEQANVFYGSDSAIEAALYTTQSTWTSLLAFTEGNTYEPWANGVPQAYIHTQLDNALPIANQNAMVELLGTDATIYSLESDHCPYLSFPDELLTIFKDVVAVAEASKA